jgi:hypothetical protein
VKVFVSHTMKDRQVAESVYSDLQSAGAQVYQFGESEALGGDAWERILTWISESDAFVVLLSPHTSKSKGVRLRSNMQATATSTRTGPAR